MPPKLHKFKVPIKKAVQFEKRGGFRGRDGLWWTDENEDGSITYFFAGLFRFQARKIKDAAESVGGYKVP